MMSILWLCMLSKKPYSITLYDFSYITFYYAVVSVLYDHYYDHKYIKKISLNKIFQADCALHQYLNEHICPALCEHLNVPSVHLEFLHLLHDVCIPLQMCAEVHENFYIQHLHRKGIFYIFFDMCVARSDCSCTIKNNHQGLP